MQFKRTNIPYTGRDKYSNGTGKKVKKSSVLYGSGGSGGGGNIGPMPWTGHTPIVGNVDIIVPSSDINKDDLTAEGYTVTVPINGYADNEQTQVWVGSLQTSGANYGISGIPYTGMSLSVTDNGTEEPKLVITFFPTIPYDSGELIIPVYINTSPYLENWGTTKESWANMDSKNKLTQRTVTYSWNLKSVGGGTGYQLILTNEVALLACQHDGTPYTSSTASLSCTATLYYGATVASDVTYSLVTTGNTQGVFINSSTGVLTFYNSYNFNGTTNVMTINASVGGSQVATKQMKVTKVCDGSDGSGGSVSTLIRWIVPSVYSIVKGIDDSLTPSSVTATVMMQSGNTAAVVDTASTIFYGFSPGNINPNIQMPSTGVTVSTNIDYLILALRNGNTSNGEVYESQTIHIVADGVGPAIRGPISWRSSLARRFSNGIGPLQSDRNFIDVVRHDIHSYVCNTSYTQESGATWESVSSAWTMDDSYSFVASKVDLDPNELIALNYTNGITVTNLSDQVVAGMNMSGIYVGGQNMGTAKISLANNGTASMNSANINGDATAQNYKTESDLNHIDTAMVSTVKLEVVLRTDKPENYIVDSGGTWFVNGEDVGISYDDYQYLVELNRYDCETLGMDLKFSGYYCLANSDTIAEDTRLWWTGIVSTGATRQNNKLYLTI